MAKQLTDLCALLIEDAYGELPAQIYRTLARWGRITLPTLIQQSDLPSRYIRHGLTVLIQQHLILHITPEADSSSFYEIDPQGAYNLVRTGRVISLVEERYGNGAGQVVSNLLQLGHARVGDLEDAYKFHAKDNSAVDSAAEHINGEGLPNGFGKDGHMAVKEQDRKITSKADLHRVLAQLLEVGFITRVHKRTFYTHADREAEAGNEVMVTEFPDGKTTGPKAKLRYEQAVNAKKRKWREEEDEVSGDVYVKQTQKRQKTNGGMTNGVNGRSQTEEGRTLQSDIVLRVNFDKCEVAMRTQQFQDYATRHLGDIAGRVYGTVLKHLERKLYRCRDDLKSSDDEDIQYPTVTTVEVLDSIDPTIDLASAIASESNDEDLTNGYHDHDRNSKGSRVKREDSEMDGGTGQSSMKATNRRLNQLEQVLRMIVESPRGFLTRSGTRGKGEWQVEFHGLTESLQSAEIESMISARYGSISTRVVRYLKVHGRLEQKSIEEGCMIRKKELLAILSNMAELGVVETQEVPKEASRQPSRSYYLWHFNQQRVAKVLLFDTYKAMTRLVQRVQVQKEFRQEIIDKAERLDVIGHEDEYLTASDKTHLRDWREEEEKLLAQIMRQDDVVALLRDF